MIAFSCKPFHSRALAGFSPLQSFETHAMADESFIFENFKIIIIEYFTIITEMGGGRVSLHFFKSYIKKARA